MRRENGITLIALIITIIILVILAAVSVRAVYEMGIVNHAVNGTQKYASEAVKENQMLDSTTSLVDRTVQNIQDTLNGSTSSDTSSTDESEKIAAFLNGDDFTDPTNGEWTVNGKTMYDLGPDFDGSVEDFSGRFTDNYCLYNGIIYKAAGTEDRDKKETTYTWTVAKTNIDASKLGSYDSETHKVTLAAGDYVCEVVEEGYVVNHFLYDGSAICLGPYGELSPSGDPGIEPEHIGDELSDEHVLP